MYVSSSNEALKLPAGTYGISNSVLSDPWPKVTTGLETFKSIIRANDDIKPEILLEMMSSSKAHDQFGEQMRSSIWIQPFPLLPGGEDLYGTRTTMVWHIATTNSIVVETSYDTTASTRKINL